MKTHWKKAFNKDYLGAHDFEIEEKEKHLQIERIEVKVVKSSRDEEGTCNVAYFVGDTKPMILNVGSCRFIESIAGSKYIDDWKNLNVTVYIANIKAFGQYVDALRLKSYTPKAKPELKANTEDFKNCVHAMKDGHLITEIRKRFSVSVEIENLLNEGVNA